MAINIVVSTAIEQMRRVYIGLTLDDSAGSADRYWRTEDLAAVVVGCLHTSPTIRALHTLKYTTHTRVNTTK